ncbi:MAG TPA: GGDEF domain-containing protein [Bdellovibrionota bacterium]|nr:GGDEF domain-containing protein [Bdellovibrionota bacterium]
MAGTRRKKKKRKKSWVYPLVGLLLSLTAPLGWLLIQVGPVLILQSGDFWSAVRADIGGNPLLYAYLQVGATVILVLSGLALGIRDDRIQEHYSHVLSQRRLLGIKNRQLARLSITDRLTGLANYFRLHEVLAAEFRRAHRYSLELCVLLVDIDHFKKINDTHGHLFGDFVLHELGQIFAANRRESDYVARTGGEEFCFVLTQTNVADAIRFAERLRESVARHRFEYKGIRTDVTLSAGVASIKDLASPTAEEGGKALMSLADEALYVAKRHGRNRVERYRPRLAEVPSPLVAKG